MRLVTILGIPRCRVIVIFTLIIIIIENYLYEEYLMNLCESIVDPFIKNN